MYIYIYIYILSIYLSIYLPIYLYVVRRALGESRVPKQSTGGGAEAESALIATKPNNDGFPFRFRDPPSPPPPETRNMFILSYLLIKTFPARAFLLFLLPGRYYYFNAATGQSSWAAAPASYPPAPPERMRMPHASCLMKDKRADVCFNVSLIIKHTIRNCLQVDYFNAEIKLGNILLHSFSYLRFRKSHFLESGRIIRCER